MSLRNILAVVALKELKTIMDTLRIGATLGSGSNRSRSSRESERDEEALIWASLERLPTYDRMRTTILESLKGGRLYREQIDLRNVGKKKLRQDLVSKLFNESSPDDDNARFLQKLRDRIDKVGLELPTIEVRFENLNVEAQMHVGSRALPTLLNSAVNTLQGCIGLLGFRIAKKTKMTILHEVSGIIKPGRMTLLLGPPSSASRLHRPACLMTPSDGQTRAGKTTLLMALAGKLSPTLEVTGRITYNGHHLDEFVPQKTSAYVSQTDLHVGEMTVRETFQFSAKCQGVGTRDEFLTELCKREKQFGIHPEADVDFFLKAAAMEETSNSLITEYMLKILGLDICADTLVGDQWHRGISGGQKKRVTTGEMIVGPMRTLFMDEISTGLDSSTTFQVVKCLGDITRTLQSTMLISLLQPAPETYNVFDDIMLLSEGQITYHGPRENILEFFETCGFKCPDRKGVADFLQEVTSWKDQEQYWIDKSVPYRFISVRELAEKFQAFHVGASVKAELRSPFDKSKSHKAALSFKRYAIPRIDLFRASLGKEWLLMKRNSFLYIFKTAQIAIMAVIAASVYLRTNMHRNSVRDAQVYNGALFFGVLNIMFNGYAELAMTIFRLPVFFKQRDMLLFPAWSFSLATLILRIPVSAVETIIWITITYYTIGFAPAVSRFFRQLLLYFCLHQMSSGLFRMMAGICRTMIVANTAGTFSLLVINVLGGFLIPRNRIKPWWIWGYWISPLAYAQNGIAALEFLSPQWDKPAFYNSTDTMGVLYLKAADLFDEDYWYWIAIGVMVAYTIIFNCLFTISITYLGPVTKPQPILSEKQRAVAHRNRTGELLRSASLSMSGPLPPQLKSLSTTRMVNNSGPSLLPAEDSDAGLTLSTLSWSHRESVGSEDFMTAASSFSSRRTTISTSSLISDSAVSVERQTRRGMILPFQALSMSFKDVSYFVDMPSPMKEKGSQDDKLQLLRGITGAFRPGILTALVGVSGAGKTTLMDVLAGRKTGGIVEGDIRISGHPKRQETFARISGYCEQTDIHSPQVTVHEALIYSAWLRLSYDIHDDSKTQFVEEVMDLVELTPLRDALVGVAAVTGLSTEQRKRLTIAVELVANPSIIFMDEPTSALDARAAAIVMRTVRNTVDTGRTVVCTIHQPSIDIFEAFDQLLLLKRGGQVTYAGPLGKKSHKLVEYFEEVPGVPKIAEGYNPATWMLEVTSLAVEQRLRVDFAEIYSQSVLCATNRGTVEELTTPARNSRELVFDRKYAQPFWRQLQCCLWKQHLTYWRSPEYNNVRIIFTITAALVFGTVFWQIGSERNSQANVIGTMAAMYGAVIFIGVNNASVVLPVVGTERVVFYRERAARMYSSGAYAIAQVLIEIPYCFVQMLIYSAITYAMIGLEWTTPKVLWYMYFMLFTFFTFTFYGMMAVGLTPSHDLATVASAFFYQFWNLFSGFLIVRGSLPKWWIWYYWACPIAWTLYGLIVSQFGDVHSQLGLLDPSQPNQTVSQFIETYFGFRHSFLPVVAIMHLVFPVLFAFVFMFTIKFISFEKR